MISGKDFHFKLTWRLFLGIVIVEGHNSHRLWSIFGTAALYVVFAALLDAANKRWPKPLHWPLHRRRNSP